MKWPSRVERMKAKAVKLGNWALWFAWYPININGYWYWLETVQRRLVFYSTDGVPWLIWHYDN